MATDRDRLSAEATELTKLVGTANAASSAYAKLLRGIREVIAIEDELSKPNKELQQMLGDVIDVAQKRRNQFDDWLSKNEPKLIEIMDRLVHGD